MDSRVVVPYVEDENSSNVITLRHDNGKNSKPLDVQIMFRLFYWAAFRGNELIVDRMIRQGYSPFM